jgi:hypothetical protein
MGAQGEKPRAHTAPLRGMANSGTDVTGVFGMHESEPEHAARLLRQVGIDGQRPVDVSKHTPAIAQRPTNRANDNCHPTSNHNRDVSEPSASTRNGAQPWYLSSTRQTRIAPVSVFTEHRRIVAGTPQGSPVLQSSAPAQIVVSEVVSVPYRELGEHGGPRSQEPGWL